jgi:hypothetical protein
MSKGSKAMGLVNRMLTSREISRAAKIRICRTVVTPAVVCKYETWVSTKKSEIKLETWKRKMLRKRFKGTRTEDRGWRRKTNREIKEHGRMSEQRHAKRALLEEEGGKKKRGRPKKKWLEAVTTHLRILGVADWKRVSQDREQWRKIVKNRNRESWALMACRTVLYRVSLKKDESITPLFIGGF